MKLLISRLLGTFFYVGYFPFASGTAGSIATLPLIWFCPNTVVYLILMIFFFVGGIIASRELCKHLGKEDPKEVVVDEVAGMMLALFLIPINWQTLLFGFLLFRIFDIFKPLFIRRLERIPNGYGVMLDDILAGIYANLLLRVILLFL